MVPGALGRYVNSSGNGQPQPAGQLRWSVHRWGVGPGTAAPNRDESSLLQSSRVQRRRHRSVGLVWVPVSGVVGVHCVWYGLVALV